MKSHKLVLMQYLVDLASSIFFIFFCLKSFLVLREVLVVHKCLNAIFR